MVAADANTLAMITETNSLATKWQNDTRTLRPVYNLNSQPLHSDRSQTLNVKIEAFSTGVKSLSWLWRYWVG